MAGPAFGIQRGQENILDLLKTRYEWSASALKAVAEEVELVINPIIYAEASIRFETPAQFDEAFSPDDFVRRDLPFAAAFLAGKAHIEYRRRGGVRAAILPDFFIGAHAAIAKYKMLTRNPRRFRRYFPTVELIAP